MLARFNFLVLRCFIAVWIVNLLARAAAHVVRGYRFSDLNHNFPLDQIGSELLLAAFSIALGWKYLRAKNIKAVTSSKAAAILDANWFYRITRVVVILLGAGILMVFTTFFAWCAISDTVKVSAALADATGAYELAERIYQRDRDPAPGLTFCSWRTLFTLEDERQASLRTAAIAKLYGADSLQMAERYEFRGANIDSATGGEPRRVPEILSYFRKALALYEKHHAYRKCVDVLDEMMLQYYDKDNLQPTRPFLLAAAQCSTLCTTPPRSLPGKHQLKIRHWAFGGLYGTALQLGDPVLVQIFKSRSDAADSKDAAGKDRYFWARAAFVAMQCALATSLGIGAPLFKYLILLAMAKRSQRLLSQSSDTDTSVRLLNKQVALSLGRGKIKQAWDESIQLLKLAGCQSAEIDTPPDFFTTGRALRNLILLDQLQAASFVAIFIVVYF